MQRGEKSAIAAGSPAQQLEIAPHAAVHFFAAHVLEIDRDLGAGDVEAENRLGLAPTPGVSRKDVGRGEVLWLIRRGRSRHLSVTSLYRTRAA